MKLTIQRQSKAVDNPQSNALYIEYRDTVYHLSELSSPLYHYIEATIISAKKVLMSEADIPVYHVQGNYGNYYQEKEEFERTHQLIEEFSFSIAIEAIKSGMKVARKHWQNHSYAHEPQYLSIKENTVFEDHVITKAIYETLISGIEIPYIPSIKDMLSDDWHIIE